MGRSRKKKQVTRKKNKKRFYMCPTDSLENITLSTSDTAKEEITEIDSSKAPEQSDVSCKDRKAINSTEGKIQRTSPGGKSSKRKARRSFRSLIREAERRRALESCEISGMLPTPKKPTITFNSNYYSKLTQGPMTNMEELWQKVCNHYEVPEDVAKSWFSRIKQRLNQTESTRSYHNWDEMIMRKKEHLQHCKPSIILAALFQYYVYDGNRNCAKENCDAFEEFCRDAQIDDISTRDLILKLLGNNIDSGEISDSYEHEANLLQDLDLVILAAPLDDYKTYTNLLRQEYGSMNDESYNLMRLKVLETLLLIPNIFLTPEYQGRFEEAARNNIQWEISKLKA